MTLGAVEGVLRRPVAQDDVSRPLQGVAELGPGAAVEDSLLRIADGHQPSAPCSRSARMRASS